MPRRRIPDDRAWLEKHLRPLIEAGRRIQARDHALPSVLPTYDKGYWTGLKLILVRYYMPTYLNIQAPKMRVAYVDLFAGPGLNLVGDAKVPLPGSPLIPFVLEGTRYQFQSYFFCETSSNYLGALRDRLRGFGSPDPDHVFLYRKDANAFVDELPDLLEQEGIGHSLVFIDPEGLEFRYEALESLVGQVQCDLILNFPSAGLNRALGKADPQTTATVRAFLGLAPNNALPGTEEDALRLYQSSLAVLGKDVSTAIRVAAGDVPYHYHLIPAVRKTRGGSQWFKALLQAKERIERLKGDVLGIVADQIEGRAGILG